MRLFATILISVVLGITGTAMGQVRYVVTDLSTFGDGTSSYALDINNSGQVTGQFVVDDYYHAFLYSDGVMHDLGTPGEMGSNGFGINEQGMVVGHAWPSGSDYFHAYLHDNGVWTDLGTLGGNQSSAAGINDSGEITGWSNTAEGTGHAFIYTGGEMIDLAIGGRGSDAMDINNSGDVAGYWYPGVSDPPRAFLYSGGSITDLGTLGGTYSLAYGLNDLGQVVGLAKTSGDVASRAFLYEDGEMVDLGTLGGNNSAAWDVNELGVVVGESYISHYSSTRHAFIYADGVMTDLNTLIPEDFGWRLGNAAAINDLGQIVGEGAHGAYLLTPVIESINATYLDSGFVPTGGNYGIGELTVSDEADIVVETAVGQTTYDDGSVSMATSLFADNSAGGLASGLFRNGTLVFQDADGIALLIGDLIELELCEVFDGAGLLAGQGLFEVTGGSLEEAFYLPYGELVQITFKIVPSDIDDFSGAFIGISNITLTPVPEPATMSLLVLGGLALIRRRRK